MTTGWQVIAASAVGSAHTDGANQDAFAHRVLGPSAVVAAVADGHGGRHYVRSAQGARMAVDIAVAVAADQLAAASASAPAAYPAGRRVELPAVCREVVSRWRAAVAADLGARPFTQPEHVRAGRDLNAAPTLAYGATLLIALVVDGRAELAQLGDGDVLALSGGRQVPDPVPGDRRLTGGMTTSLGSEDAADDCRFGSVQPVEMLVLSSDGYGNSFADPQWRAVVLDDLRRAVAAHGVAAVQREFDGWLRESARAGGDDVTAVILVDPSALTPAPPPASGSSPPHTSLSSPGHAAGAALAATVLTGPPAEAGSAAHRTMLGHPPSAMSDVSVVPAGQVSQPETLPPALPPPRSTTGWWAAGVAGALLIGGAVGFVLARGPLAPAPVVQRVVEQTQVTVTGPAVSVTVPTTVSTMVPTTVTATTTVTTTSTAPLFGTDTGAATATGTESATGTGTATNEPGGPDLVPSAQTPTDETTGP